MDRELESLLLAYDAWLQAGPGDATQSEANFETLLDEIAVSRSNLNKDKLFQAVHAYYPRWLRAQQHPPTIPPKA